jgi:hypothetical protein
VNIRRLALDVDKAIARPSVIEIAEAISPCSGVEALNITVSEIDVETVGMEVAIEGDNLNYQQILQAIESIGAALHSLDQIVCGERIVERK